MGGVAWSEIALLGLLWGQLPARYVIKGDALSFLWREYRIAGEYRLFRWAPPFIASVERHRWEGLTLLLSTSYYRRLPHRGALARIGARYYFHRPAYAPEGLWAGVHITTGGSAARQEVTRWVIGGGLTVGYQHIFHQAYGGTVEPYLLLDLVGGRAKWVFPFQIGLQVGFAARKWNRRNLP
jgi:hypothetical protein